MNITALNEAKIRIAAALFILLLFSYIYFIQNPQNDNSVPRIGLALSMVEDGSLNIDKYHKYTVDIAYYKNHYYMEKAPGQTFLALPAIAAASSVMKYSISNLSWIREDGGLTTGYNILTHIATICTSGVITVITALSIYFLALRMGAGLGPATFGALVYGLATPAWGWATAFFSHTVAAGLLFLGFASIYCLIDSSKNRWRDIVLGFLSGALLSWAVVTEFTSAPASAIIALYGLYNARYWDRGRFINVFVSAVLGAVIFILPLLVYHYVITGNIFESLYRYHMQFPGLDEGFYGIALPDLKVALTLLFGQNNGLFWLSPLLLTAPFALYSLWKNRGKKSLVITITLITIYYLLWNSAFTYWDGGASTGPRYLIPILPFLCLPISLFLARSGTTIKAVIVVLFVASLLVSLMSVSVSMFHNNASIALLNGTPDTGSIITAYLLPRFIEGQDFQISLSNYSFFSLKALLNKDLHGQILLMPLYAIYLCFGIYIVWEIKRFRSSQLEI